MIPPLTNLFGDWTVAWVGVALIMGGFYLWAKFHK